MEVRAKCEASLKRLVEFLEARKNDVYPSGVQSQFVKRSTPEFTRLIVATLQETLTTLEDPRCRGNFCRSTIQTSIQCLGFQDGSTSTDASSAFQVHSPIAKSSPLFAASNKLKHLSLSKTLSDRNLDTGTHFRMHPIGMVTSTQHRTIVISADTGPIRPWPPGVSSRLAMVLRSTTGDGPH